MKEFVPNDHYYQFSVKQLELNQSDFPAQAKAIVHRGPCLQVIISLRLSTEAVFDRLRYL